jgi:hypothetical protein
VVAFSCENFIRLGVALVSGAATAWIVESEPDQDKAIGANSPGLAIGAFMAGILAQYAPSPLRLSYPGVHSSVDSDCCRDLEDGRDRAQTALVRRSFYCAATGSSTGDVRNVCAGSSRCICDVYTALVPTLLEKALENKNHASAGGIVGELFFGRRNRDCGDAAITTSLRIADRIAAKSRLCRRS